MGNVEYMMKVLDIQNDPLKIAALVRKNVWNSYCRFHDTLKEKFNVESVDDLPWIEQFGLQTLMDTCYLMDGILALEKERLKKEKALLTMSIQS